MFPSLIDSYTRCMLIMTPQAFDLISIDAGCCPCWLSKLTLYYSIAYTRYHCQGRHKRQGLLENAARGGYCMGRYVGANVAWGSTVSDQVELDVGLLPCTAKTHHPVYDCTQLWSLPALNTSRWYNRVESTHRIPPPATSAASGGTQAARTPQAEDAAAALARKSGRVLCWILAYPPTHANRATAVNQTWGRRCDTLLFMSSELFPDMPVVKLDIGGPEARNKIWTKSMLAWLHVYDNYLDKADWFVKAVRSNVWRPMSTAYNTAALIMMHLPLLGTTVQQQPQL